MIQALLLFAFIGASSPTGVYHPTVLTEAGAAFTAQAMNASVGTDPIEVERGAILILEVAHTYDAATHINMTCTQAHSKHDSGTGSTEFEIPDCSAATSPDLTCEQRRYRWVTNGASSNFLFKVPADYRYVTCAFIGTSATASDTISVTASLKFN